MRHIDRHREEEFTLTPKKRPGPPLTFLEQRHWIEDTEGILDVAGRLLFPAGFTHAIRKLLDEQPKETAAL
jgi:hypothetical protein